MKKFFMAEELLFGSADKIKKYETVNFVCSAEGENYFRSPPRSLLSSNLGSFTLTNEEINENVLIKTYKAEKRAVEVIVKYEKFDTTNAIRQTVSVKNVSSDKVIINHISSGKITGLGIDGKLPWYDKERFVIHTCDMSWQGEAQWNHFAFKDVNLVPTTTHFNHKDFRIQSIGSWTTCRNYPMIILEDTETKKSFYLEVEPAGSWEIGIGNHNTGFAEDGCIAVEANCCNIDHDGWYVELESGEEFIAQPCVYGYTDGGFEEAVRELNAYKRETSLVKFKNNTIPVVYNCYMDGIFSNPRTENLIPLIDKCAVLGVDVFCVDAGWFRSDKPNSKNAIGDYNIAEDRFEGYGLKGIFDYMKSKNIIPGIWIEAECAQEGDAYYMSEKCIGKRNALPLGNKRAFFDFRDETVRKYFTKLIDMLYLMGVRYIKNDYNQCTGYGFSNYGEACSKESADSVLATLSFFDEIRVMHPDLVVENCGSGGMREDNNTLKHFALQSTSDQELHYRTTSIASGSIAVMPPEKAGIWALTYPCYCNGESDKPFNDKALWDMKRAKMADGEESVYNMANAMIGNLYLAGRIDACDELNENLIKEGIAIYKNDSEFILGANPIWPTGTFKLCDKGVFSTGLIGKENNKILLYVWKIDTKETHTEIDLSKWVKTNAEVNLHYPKNDGKCDFAFNNISKKLKVNMPDYKYSARIFEILF